ncbi:LCP family protein [Micromonospora yangpuensis]|uniref:Transcriptional attenuator, LytR family n=1 Tax=Micromonospora yangpuensis TaxID=683228 RepID=A0A1C6TUC3_9ACTN|nr:LCP family protein [Micromonospora yangpuensis]SCL45396.1 transcriptional attenuator, LytR family [Micromonospora yangpuensis]SCL45809.1 transcriptional attenuator, LytR family [Micromonospora yangpuensis]
MSATSSAGDSLPYLHRGAGRASVPGPARGAGRSRPAAQWYPSHDDGPAGAGPGGPGGPRQPDGPAGPAPRGRQPRWRRGVLVVGVVVLVLALVGGGGAWFYTRSLNSDLARTDPFSEITGGRPAKTVDGALNILLVGSDSRDPDAPVEEASKWRADTIIVMHIPSDHRSAYLVSIPRDLYVPIPEAANAECGSGNRGKINAAFAFGGLPLAVRTVECFTDVRLDHVMAIDFAGFKQVTDALGGVDLKVERTTTSIHKPFRTFEKGTNHMNGAEALDWIRQRKQFPDGDFARMRHQQEFLRALMDKAASSGTLTNPPKLNAFLRATTDAVTVDQGFSLADMALQFRNLRGENLTFVTSPHAGSETINGESVVVSDREKALAMYQAITADTMAEWVQANEKPADSGGS